MSLDATDTALILRFYELFNQRRLPEAAALVADECEFEHRDTRERAIGPRGYLAFAEEWLHAIPDLSAAVVSVTLVETGKYTVKVRASGHAEQPVRLTTGNPTGGDGQPVSIDAMQEICVRDGRIVSSRTSYT